MDDTSNQGAQDPQNLENNPKFNILDKAKELGIEDEDFLKSVQTLDFQRKHNREKAEKTLKDFEDYKKSHPETPVLPPVPPPAPIVENTDEKIEKITQKVLVDNKKSEFLIGVPEDKRTSVDEIFKSLTVGKDITVQNINSYFEMAVKAIGIEKETVSFNKINSLANGSVPRDSKPGPTPEQIALAKKLGNDPNEVYGEKVDYSSMAGAEKFIGK